MTNTKCQRVEDLLGRTLIDVVRVSTEDKIIFVLEDSKYALLHYPDCCESVNIEDICGDLQDLVGSPLTMAEVSTNQDDPKSEYDESWTWTFYRFATTKGYVTIRWYGTSNGYYSEEVSFCEEPLSNVESLAVSCGLRLDTPTYIVADRLEELGRYEEANTLRP